MQLKSTAGVLEKTVPNFRPTRPKTLTKAEFFVLRLLRAFQKNPIAAARTYMPPISAISNMSSNGIATGGGGDVSPQPKNWSGQHVLCPPPPPIMIFRSNHDYPWRTIRFNACLFLADRRSCLFQHSWKLWVKTMYTRSFLYLLYIVVVLSLFLARVSRPVCLAWVAR